MANENDDIPPDIRRDNLIKRYEGYRDNCQGQGTRWYWQEKIDALLKEDQKPLEGNK